MLTFCEFDLMKMYMKVDEKLILCAKKCIKIVDCNMVNIHELFVKFV